MMLQSSEHSYRGFRSCLVSLDHAADRSLAKMLPVLNGDVAESVLYIVHPASPECPKHYVNASH